MTPAAARASYRRLITPHGETVTIRRYTSGELEGTYVEAAALARVIGASKEELTDGRQQSISGLIVLAEDLEGSLVTLPLVPDDKVIVRSRELNIEIPDDSTRRLGGTLVAIELKVMG